MDLPFPDTNPNQPKSPGLSCAHRLYSLLMLVPLLLLVSAPAQAEPLQPFTAKYQITVSKIPMPVSATLSLQRLEKFPGMYKMKLVIDSWLLSNREVSVFAWNDCQPQTAYYIHEFEGLGRHRWHHMDFQWHPPRVVTTSKEEGTITYPIDKQTLDELTVLLTAGCALEKGKDSYTAKAAYGDDVEKYHFKVIGHETLDTPIGTLKTIVVKAQHDPDSTRKTLFWVAPKLNYMMVRAKHVVNPLLFGELIITEYHRLGGKASTNASAKASSGTDQQTEGG